MFQVTGNLHLSHPSTSGVLSGGRLGRKMGLLGQEYGDDNVIIDDDVEYATLPEEVPYN